MPSRRRLDVERLAEAQRAAKVAGASAGQWWRTLSTAAEVTTTERSLDSLFRDSIVAMGKALEVDTVAVLLANEAGDELIARAATGLPEEASLNLGIRAGEGMAGWVLANRRPLIVADLSKITVVNATLRDSGVRSLVAVPMLSDDHPLGVLYAGSYELDRFNSTDVGMLELLADRLAAAIERVRLFETERAARNQAERLADRLERTQTITARLAATTTVEEVGTALAESIVGGRDDADVIWTSVWLLRADMLEPFTSSSSDSAGPELAPQKLHGDSPIAVAARQTVPMYFDNPIDNQRLFPVLGVAFPGSSVAVLPIILEGHCFGVLVAVYRPGRSLSSDERDFLVAVVGQVAQALERARLSVAQVQLAEVSDFFARAARVLAEGSDLADTLNRLASVALPALGDICLIDVIGDDGRITRMVARHRDRSRQYLVDRLRMRYAPEAGGPHPAASVISTGDTRWAPTMSDEFLAATTQDEEHLVLTKTLEFRSYISVPLRYRQSTLGSVTLVSTSRSYGTDDVAFAEQLAEQVAAVVHKARRYDMATHTSHILQSTLLPQRFAHVPGLSVHTRYVAASEGLEVGGDFFDLVPVGQGRVSFMIGDVAGHDRIAAALMGQLRSAARTLAGRIHSPAEMIEALQQSWGRLDFDRMATAVVGLLDVGTGALSIASAGHYPPLLIEAGASHYLPVTPSTPLGVQGPAPANWTGALGTGQTLLLYTDGVIDERHKGAEASMAELARVAQSALSHSGDLDGLCTEVVDMLSPERVDDVALLAMKLDG